MRRLRFRVRDDGSALMLVPAGVLVLITLGAVAIDSAVIMFAQRDLQNRTAAVVNDAATLALVEDAFYAGGEVRLSPEAASTYTATAFSTANMPAGYEAWGAAARASGRTVEVRAWADVPTIFLRALPGLPDTSRVEATSEATAEGV